MGFILGCLLVGVVVLEEIERLPANGWNGMGTLFRLFLFPTTRRRPVLMLSVGLGMFFVGFEVRQVINGRGTFNPIQGLAMFGLLLALGIRAARKK